MKRIFDQPTKEAAKERLREAVTALEGKYAKVARLVEAADESRTTSGESAGATSASSRWTSSNPSSR